MFIIFLPEFLAFSLQPLRFILESMLNFMCDFRHFFTTVVGNLRHFLAVLMGYFRYSIAAIHFGGYDIWWLYTIGFTRPCGRIHPLHITRPVSAIQNIHKSQYSTQSTQRTRPLVLWSLLLWHSDHRESVEVEQHSQVYDFVQTISSPWLTDLAYQGLGHKKQRYIYGGEKIGKPWYI